MEKQLNPTLRQECHDCALHYRYETCPSALSTIESLPCPYKVTASQTGKEASHAE